MPWLALLLISIFVHPLPAEAVIYQCRDQRGTLHLTDDPDNLPAGCKDRQTRLQKKDLETPSATPAAPAEPPRKKAPVEDGTEDEEKSLQSPPAERQGGR